jgi:ornithine decarboxylase
LLKELSSRFTSSSKSFVVVDKGKLQKQVSIWNTHLPFVTPYYAVKSNNDATLMTWMTSLFEDKMGFDCASIAEMESVRKISKKAPIVYAQPCKTRPDINESVRYGVRITVVDSPEEIEKLGRSGWKGDVLIRLLVPDMNSRQPFGKKFGAPIQWVPTIIELAKQYKINVSGLSFHVGSECENPAQFAKALKLCKLAMDLAYEQQIKMNIIDIGGGFLPEESNLSAVASSIQSAAAEHFPNNLSPSQTPIQWIAEPGRFLSSKTQTLYTPIIGKKRGLPNDEIEFRYTLHESVYGYFSNIPFDGQKPEFKIAHKQNKTLTEKLFPSILFGRTCDGADIINPKINLPPMEEGDWLVIENMGAYTNVAASEFNGFPKPDRIYIS